MDARRRGSITRKFARTLRAIILLWTRLGVDQIIKQVYGHLTFSLRAYPSTDPTPLELHMSAYGALSRSARASPLRLPTTEWLHPRDPQTTITLFHFSPSAIGDALSPSLFNHLHAVFADEVDKGLTYPQEEIRDPDAFRAYFFAADVVIAIVGLCPQEECASLSAPGSEQDDEVPREVEVDLEGASAGRSWDECMVGFYYVRWLIRVYAFVPPRLCASRSNH